MVDPKDPYRKPEDIGTDSPPTGEAKRQAITGARGGPRASQTRGVGKQPAQESGRRSSRHEHLPEEVKSFTPDEDPSEQGTGDPSPEQLKARSSLQGIGPRSGSHQSRGERTEELAQQGPPDHGHTRAGRQRVPGQPNRPIPRDRKEDEYT